MPTIVLRNVSKRYGDMVAVGDVSLDIASGEMLVILGSSGCGKTTTLRLIAGLESPDSGEISIDGQIVSTPTGIVPPHKRQIGMVFQDLALWPHMRVNGNLEFGLKVRRLKKVDRRAKMQQILELVKMTEYADAFPANLSGGQKQRVAIARALALEPRILLMDEPLANLDVLLKKELQNEIVHLHRQLNITTVYVTHSQNEALTIANRIVVMNQGRIEQVGVPREIFYNPNTEFVAKFVNTKNVG
jgi:ABC-type Fe3+/spermidine/putrescine transport system ATPase subunit